MLIYRKKRENNIKITLIQNQRAKIEGGNNSNNNRTLLVGSSFSGKAYLLIKVL